DDDAGVITVRTTSADASEDGPKAGKVVFTRTGQTNSAQTVFFQVSGSATSGNDFQPLGNSITIPAGANSYTMLVVPVDDPSQEFTETVKLTLLDAPGATIGDPSSALVTIKDNDGT